MLKLLSVGIVLASVQVQSAQAAAPSPVVTGFRHFHGRPIVVPPPRVVPVNPRVTPGPINYPPYNRYNQNCTTLVCLH